MGSVRQPNVVPALVLIGQMKTSIVKKSRNPSTLSGSIPSKPLGRTQAHPSFHDRPQDIKTANVQPPLPFPVIEIGPYYFIGELRRIGPPVFPSTSVHIADHSPTLLMQHCNDGRIIVEQVNIVHTDIKRLVHRQVIKLPLPTHVQFRMPNLNPRRWCLCCRRAQMCGGKGWFRASASSHL
jgi:hypothetical protein